MSDDFEEQIKREFIVEASEMLEAVESEFINLERSSDDLAIIDNIFRMAHSIKGSAFACGFNELGEFAHSVEMLLVNIREKKIEMTGEVIDTLLKANDCLKELLEVLRDQSGKKIPTSHIVTDINNHIDRKYNVKPVSVPVQQMPEVAAVAAVAAVQNEDQMKEIRFLVSDVVRESLDSYIGLVKSIEQNGSNSDFSKVVIGFESVLEKVKYLYSVATKVV